MGDLARRGIDIGQVRKAVAAPGWGTDGDEDRIGLGDGPREVGVKESRFASVLLRTSSDRPGSKIGISPCFSAAILLSILSTQTTSWPKSAKQAPDTSPT